ncbi:hypothetical protein [Nocardioides sp.]|nr:hypothetical protein [Nocardioides sp.]HXH77303.1 hypothetical protein [Nocardioides sp.]
MRYDSDRLAQRLAAMLDGYDGPAGHLGLPEFLQAALDEYRAAVAAERE